MRYSTVMWARTICLTVAVLTPIAALAAEQPGEAFRAFGLEGVWAPDCQAPVSTANPRVYWSGSADGTVRHGVTFDGKAWALIDTIVYATLLGDDRLLFSASRGSGLTLTVTVERVGDRVRSVSSVAQDGHAYVTDGIETATGLPALFDERCDVVTPVS